MGVRKELFVGLGTALATAAGLFTLQLWYASYLDVAVVHGDQSGVHLDAKLEAVRNEEHAKLSAGRMPIHQAMEALAQRGRNAFPKLAAQPSNDLSAMSGWIKKPGFKPYVPRAAAATAEATPLAWGAAASTGAHDSAPEEQRHAR
ncbi:MAG: hypothetical protein ABI895_23855 [Deltaproteobacteria bacterium]